MDVAMWLRELDLERYTQAFEDNDVDAQALLLLTGTDLADLGVTSVGHRRKLLEAIAALRGGTAAAAPPPPTPLNAERRQLTVLYCDMCRTAELSADADAENIREAVRSFHEGCTRVVAEFEGHVANFYGDCLLAYFGWPRAHEDDAERAVRAGLALARELSPSNEPGPTSSRVGIATGDVVVGDLIRDGPAQQQSAVGLAPNLGARMLALAGSGQVVIDELTQRLLPPSFALQPLGHQALKGIGEPVAAYRVSGERPADTRFDAQRGRGLAPMIGRDQELALLQSRWAQAQAGEGQTVLLTGEAGIGKSRIVRALLDLCAAQTHPALRWQCSPHHTGSALWPVMQRLSRAARLSAQDSNEQALDKLEATVSSEAAALYAPLLGLDGAARYGPLQMTPQMLRARTLELTVEQLFGLTEQGPLLLVVEDAHWIDPTTLELLERCLERIDSAPMLVLVTSRPANAPAFRGHASVTELSLNRLGRPHVEALVSSLGGSGLSAQTLETIVARTDGVPLFAEELTKAVLESGQAAIPASLHGSLMARLDHIPEFKEIAQAAACIGREFDRALLQAVVDRPDTVPAAIERLAAVQLVFRVGGPADPHFVFKHALVQEAASESLLHSKRRRIHARIVDALESQRTGTPPEILAHHAEHADLNDKAIAYWEQAGNAALATSAYREAAAFFERAIARTQAQLPSADRSTLEFRLQLKLGQAHMASQGFGAEATGTTFRRAHELLATQPGAGLYGVLVQFGFWGWQISRGHVTAALPLATHALATAHPQATAEERSCLERMVAVTHLFLGELANAREHFEKALAAMDSATKRSGLAEQFGVDPRVAALYYFACVRCIEGHVEQSRTLIAQARAMAFASPHVHQRAQVHLFSALNAACARDHATVAEEAEALAELAGRHRLVMMKGYAEVFRGLAATGPAEAAIAAHERGLATLDSAGVRIGLPVFIASRAASLGGCGRDEEAWQIIRRELEACDETGQTWYVSELWRTRGTLLLQRPRADPAEAARCFERALATARAQGAKLWELRAAVSLGRLWAGQGDSAGALRLLTPLYASFTEGFDAVDLVEAKDLLRTLSQPVAHDGPARSEYHVGGLR